MQPDRLPPKNFPRVPFERRFYAFAIDLTVTWLLSSFAGSGAAHAIVFFFLWAFLNTRLSFWCGMGIPISIAGALAVIWPLGADSDVGRR